MNENTRKIYEAVHASELFWSVARVRLVRSLLKGGNVLDVGCGDGITTVLLGREGYEIAGIDMSPCAVRMARSNARRMGLTVPFFCKDISGVRKKYDNVLLLDVLEHIKDDLSFLKQIKKRLKKSGFLVLTVPASMFLWGRWDVESCHLRRYSLPGILGTVKAAGLDIDAFGYWNMFMLPFVLLYSRVLGRAYPVEAVSKSRTCMFLNRIVLRWFYIVENRLSFPFGTSIVIRAMADNHGKKRA